MNTNYPYIDWLKLIRSVLPNDVNITGNSTVAVGNVEYVKYLGDILSNVSNRTLANYLVWRSILFSSKFLNKELFNRNFNFTAELEGAVEQKPRHIQCVDYANEQ